MEKIIGTNLYLKSKINLLYLVSMLALLFVHNYNFAPYSITPSTIVNGRFDVFNFLELLFSNSLLRFRLALLMAISGYLMANSPVVPYHELVIKKIKSFVVPFLIISAMGLVITLFFETALFGFHNTHTHGIIGKSLWDFTIKDWFGYLLITPVSFQLWYMKVIFILALFSPVIRFVLQKFPVPTLAIGLAVWLFTNYIDGEMRERAFVFYLIGFYLSIYKVDISRPFAFLKPATALNFFIAIAFLRTTLAFSNIGHEVAVKYSMILLYKVNEILGVYSIWFCIDSVANQLISTSWYKKYGRCSFFIFAFHAPLINYLGECCLTKGLYTSSSAHILLYLAIPILVLIILVNAEHVLKLYTPNFFLLVTGGRGADSLSDSVLDKHNHEGSRLRDVLKDILNKLLHQQRRGLGISFN